MAKKFPAWHRPDLKERQLVGEEARLSARGLTAEQVRADLIQLLACREQLAIAHDTLMGIARAWLARQGGEERKAA